MKVATVEKSVAAIYHVIWWLHPIRSWVCATQLISHPLPPILKVSIPAVSKKSPVHAISLRKLVCLVSAKDFGGLMNGLGIADSDDTLG